VSASDAPFAPFLDAHHSFNIMKKNEEVVRWDVKRPKQILAILRGYHINLFKICTLIYSVHTRNRTLFPNVPSRQSQSW
jgi:hypothetical protein